MALEQRTPVRVAELGGPLGGPDDVGEQHGGQHPVGLAHVARAGEELLDLADQRVGVPHGEEAVAALQLDVAGARDVLGQVAGVLDLQERVVAAVHHQRRHPNRGQHVPHVGSTDHVLDLPDRARARRVALHPARPFDEVGVRGLARRDAGADQPLPPLRDEHIEVAGPVLGLRRPVVVGRPRRAGERRIEHQRGHLVRVRGGEGHRERSALERPEQRGALASRRLHHGQHVVDLLLERRGADHRVREARAAAVEADQAGEAAHLLHERLDRRLLAEDLELPDPRGDVDQVDRVLPALRLPGDVDIAALGVTRGEAHGILRLLRRILGSRVKGRGVPRR